jgi:hypothetical protein
MRGTLQIKGTIVACAVAVWLAAPAAGSDSARQARVEVEAAERAVECARRQRALWTTAQEALVDARAALERGDYAGAARAARFAREQAHLGIEQAGAPRYP